MADNLKFRLEQAAVDPHAADLNDVPEGTDQAQAEDAESQMRRALGLLGEARRPRTEPERAEVQHTRIGDRFSSGTHRRRFVQDGDIPVTVLRREPGHDSQVHRLPAQTAAPASNRLQRVEATLLAETAAREKAERALSEANGTLRDLQTKIGHAELARHEATEALQREREANAEFRQEQSERTRSAMERAEAAEAELTLVRDLLMQEQQTRQAIEARLQTAEAEKEAAQQLLQSVSAAPEPIPAQKPKPPRRVSDSPAVSPAIRRRRAASPSLLEAEPVKWWLNEFSTRRR